MTHKALTEEQLILLLKQKDSKGMAYLYDRYAAALNGVILQTVPQEIIAQDLLQECFMKIWNKVDSFDPSKGRLFTWMLRIARNTAIDFTRSRSFKAMGKNQVLDPSFSNRSGISVAMNTDQIGLKELVAQLKVEQKVLIDLLYFQGYSQSEAAKELGLPLGTVKTRTRAALRILRNITQSS